MAVARASTRIAAPNAHHRTVATPRDAVVRPLQAKASAHAAGPNASSRLAPPPTTQWLFRSHTPQRYTLARGFLDKLFGGGPSDERADAANDSDGQEASDLEHPFLEDIVEGAHAGAELTAACTHVPWLDTQELRAWRADSASWGGMDDHLIGSDVSGGELRAAGTFLEGRTLKLAYKATRDGFSCLQFHKRCDYKGPCVVLCTTKDGLRCGGFNPQGTAPASTNRASFVLPVRGGRVSPHGFRLAGMMGTQVGSAPTTIKTLSTRSSSICPTPSPTASNTARRCVRGALAASSQSFALVLHAFVYLAGSYVLWFRTWVVR
jgi:hypothetical protein